MALFIQHAFYCVSNFEDKLTTLLEKNADEIDNTLTAAIFELNNQQPYFERTTNRTADTILFMQRSSNLPDYLPNLSINLIRTQLSYHNDELDLKLETKLIWKRFQPDWMHLYTQYCDLHDNVFVPLQQHPSPTGGIADTWSEWGTAERNCISKLGRLPGYRSLK